MDGAIKEIASLLARHERAPFFGAGLSRQLEAAL
jgi:hypothetical protein